MSDVLEQIGSYAVVRLIARGGMGTVYEGHHAALDRAVALKRLDLHTNDPTHVERFIREGRIGASFDHPNVVTVFDFFEWEGVPYIAMEYLPHGSLRRWIGRLEPRQVFGALEGILAALAHAEQHGVAHRDLKPENVLVTGRGAVKIADFGIAKAYTHATSSFTATGVTVGTPTYMAPEQAEGRPVGAFTDLYALGVMTFEMFSGSPPFEGGDTPMATLYRHVHEPAPPLTAAAPAVAAWVARLLEKAPDQRPASAAEAWDALEEIIVERHGPYWRRDAPLAQSSSPRPSPGAAAATTVVPWRRRRLVGLGSVAAVAAAALAAVAVSLGPRDDPVEPVRAGGQAPRLVPPPFDFNGDGRPTIVAGLPGSPALAGVVAVPHASRLITASTPAPGDGFGAALASADFDQDGRADLAIGSPGRDVGDASRREGVVAVVYGSPPWLDDAQRALFRGTRIDLPYRSARYGAALAAGDVNRDRYPDLVVGAPGAGAVQVLFGTARGLTVARTRTIRRPHQGWRRFGSVLALGDIDRDGHVDLLEAAPGAPERGVPGHAAFCPGSPGGPSSCRAMGRDLAGGPEAMAIADVTGDRHPDVVHGVPVNAFAGTGARAPAGAVMLWPGSPRGPSARPLVITQRSPGVPGNEAPGDAFGSAVAARDLDRDGFADIVVGVPGKDRASGRLAVIRGARTGHAATGGLLYSQGTPSVPGVKRPRHRFGAALALLDLDGDGSLDLTVAAPGLRGSLVMLPGARGRFTGSGAARSELARPEGAEQTPAQPVITLGS